MPQAGGADRSSSTTSALFGKGSGASALAVLLLLGLALRLTVAYVLFPGSGFAVDIGSFTAWALVLADHGGGRFYDVAGFADYPPGYMYVLWLIGGLGHLLAPLTATDAGAVVGALIKVPPMLADIAVGGLLFALVRGWAKERADAERLGLLAAALYVFNPVSWYDSALWGQTDAIGALVLLLAVAALVRGNSEGAAALTVLAALVKPQFGVVLVPIVGAVLLRRHLFAPGSAPRHQPMVPPRLRAWFEEEHGPWRLLTSALAGLLVLIVVLTPFGLDIVGFVELMMSTAAGYPWLSVNAYNPWALVGAGGRTALADGGGWSPDTVALLGPLPGVVIGAGLLAGSFVVAMARLAWRDDRRSIIVVAIFVALAFFMLPTRVHERYMFPIFALLPLLAVVDRRWLWATVVLSAAAMINFHGVLTNPLYATPNIADLPLGELFRQPIGIYGSVLLHAAGFGFVAWRLLPRHARAPDHIATRSPRSAVPIAGAFGRPLSPLRQLARIFAVAPIRRDRTASLAGERGGRIDRLDLLLLLVVFVGTLGLRTVNLGQPYGMHFDEVYHARTGTEFLQHWRYGIRHSIYEWTHPHLAKYAMALGIEALGNNRVIETSSLGVPVNAVALERRWDESGDARRGDRAYLATAHELRVIDLVTGQQVATLPAFAEAITLDENAHVLYLADAAGGLWQLPTTALDALRADPAAPVAGYLEPLARLELPSPPVKLAAGGDQLVVVTGNGLLVAVDAITGGELARTEVPGTAAVQRVTTDEADGWIVGSEVGLVLLDAATLEEVETFGVGAPVTGMALVTEGVDRPTIYAAAGDSVALLRVPSAESPSLGERIQMPAGVRDVFANPATALVHVLGSLPDAAGETLYVIEPHSNSIFADAALPFSPRGLLMDVQPRRPASDRLNAVAISATGELATVDVGSNSFAWRFPGVLAGALMAVCVYLLARFLFSRRAVAVIAALLVLVDGMAFANARIAMNDTYVALFIVAAFTVFAPLYIGRIRSPLAVTTAVLGVAVLLGLALATKWVGAYALGGIGLLILLRSALGRLLALAAMVSMTAVLGLIAVSVPAGAEVAQPNLLFLGLMIGLTLLLAVAMVLRPVRMSSDEQRLAIVGPAIVGGLVLLAGAGLALSGAQVEPGALLTPARLLVAGTVLVALAAAAFLLARLSGSRADPSLDTAEPPPAWLRPGAGRLGLPWLATLSVLIAVPLLIYALSYAPWVELGNRWLPGAPAGHTGQTLLDLQRGMYNYHNDLRATHAAGSPWWAWPLDLKPVWFYQRDFAGDTTGVIYNTGNMVVFWLGIFGFAFAAYQAWRRRSLALALVVLAAASLWLPWARIDRVTFQYHYFTVLPFVIIALAYFLAELWHGPSPRVWLLARVAGAFAILLPPLLWLFRLPLCAVARVEQVNPNAEICRTATSGPLLVNALQLAGLAAACVGAVLLIAGLLWRGDAPAFWRRLGAAPAVLGVVLVVGGVAAAAGGAFLPAERRVPLPFGELVSAAAWLVGPLVVLGALAVFAYFVLRARDPRRFIVGALVAAGAWLALWYPNISGLPVPRALSQIHLGVLPTLNYSFQFGANTDPAGGRLDVIGVLMLGAVVLMLVGAAAYAAMAWRTAKVDGRPIQPIEQAG